MGERTRRTAQRLGFVALAAGLLLPGATPAATAAGRPTAPWFDVRTLAAGPRAQGAGSGARFRADAARAALRRRFGDGVVLRTDPVTGLTRVVQRLDGALTDPASGPRSRVARGWLRSQAGLLGLEPAALDELAIADSTTSGPSGLTRVRFAQRYRGLEVFDGGVQVTLDRGGRVLSAVGTPLPDPAVDSVVPALDAAAAARALEQATAPSDPVVGAPPELVVFGAPAGPALAWHLLRELDTGSTDEAVVDAGSGRVLFRQSLTKFEAPSRIYPSFPGAEDDPRPGVASANAPGDVYLDASGWLDAGADRLEGPYAHASSDKNADNVVQGVEEVRRQDGGFAFDFVAFPCAGATIQPGPRCAWDAGDSDTALRNRRQSTVQSFVLVNRFHDHLLRGTIDFDTEGFEGDDRVQVDTLDGAETVQPGTFAQPDPAYLNNANMTVLPNGLPPRLQTYLFGAPYRAIDAGDDAATVWHEYAHGLSGRLVTHGADGTSALSSIHAGALGEGWSDFYALDLLDRKGLQPDDLGVSGDVDIGRYSDVTPHTTRTQGADCAVGAAPSGCPGTRTAGSGGYTLADFGRIAAGPEVHADGELWLETLWDLRRALIDELDSTEAGSDAAERLVTDALRLSPPEPSFLDARNALLVADTAAGGRHHALLWRVFADRGLGYFAGVEDARDIKPVADRHAPPGGQDPTGTVAGQVTDADSGLPLAGVRVAAPVPEGEGPAQTTGSDGRYALALPAGFYARLTLTGPAGFDPEGRSATVAAGAITTLTPEVSLHRDWAAEAGGARLETPVGGTCGPGGLIDDVDGSGWSADVPDRGPDPSVTIVLPRSIDVSQIGIDPAAGCGDTAGSALGGYEVTGVLADGSERLLASGTFGPGAAGKLNPLALSNTRGISKVRLTLKSAQSPDSAYIDVAALSIYGYPPNQRPTGSLTATPATVDPGAPIRLDAAFTDPDSRIRQYSWDFDGNGTTDRVTSGPTTTTSYGTAGVHVPTVLAEDVRTPDKGGAFAVVRVNDLAPARPPATTPAPTTSQLPTPVPPPLPAPSLVIAPTGRRGASSVTVTCRSRCAVFARATVSAATARRLKLKRPYRTVMTAAWTRAASRTSARRVLRLPAAVRKAAGAAGLKSLTLTLTVRAKDASGRVTSRRRTVRVTL